jgi:hypothetical protein
MFDELISNLENTVKTQLQERFGIDPQQATDSFNVVKENISGVFKNGFNPQDLLQNFSNLEHSETVQNLKSGILLQLQDKVGLSEETAQKVNDFSLAEIMKNVTAEITGEDGKPDIQKILAKFNLEDLQKMAGNMFGNIFNKQ